MKRRSGIEWTEVTWNPTTGCDRVSEGCDNCYALTMAKRLKAMGSERYQQDGDPRTSGPGFALTVHPDALEQPYRWSGNRTVFVNSMSDLFHAKVPVSFVRAVFEVITNTPQHTYQVLTKRSARLPKLADKLEWPNNLWLGVSVENAKHLDRVDHLRQVPAAVRFLSCEPLLGPLTGLDLTGIGWVITGGESGPQARPLDPEWVRDIRDTCVEARVPFFHKQWGGRTPKAHGRILDGIVWDELPNTGAPATAADAVYGTNEGVDGVPGCGDREDGRHDEHRPHEQHTHPHEREGTPATHTGQRAGVVTDGPAVAVDARVRGERVLELVPAGSH